VDGYTLHQYSPDLSHERSLFPLVWIVVTTPCYILCGLLLFHRRTTFPIVARGARLLWTLSMLFYASTLAWMIPTIWFPDGMPCGIQTIALYLSLTGVLMIYAIRGWILVFRWEITQQLTLFRQRTQKGHQRSARIHQQQQQQSATPQQQPQQSQRHHRLSSLSLHATKVVPLPSAVPMPQPASGTTSISIGCNGAAATSIPTATNVHTNNKPNPSPPLSSEAPNNNSNSNDPPTHRSQAKLNHLDLLYEGAGGWYVKHRHLSESRFLNRVVGGVYAVVVLTLIIFVFWDPDIEMNGGKGTDIANVFKYGMYGQQQDPLDPNAPTFERLHSCALWSMKIMIIRIYMSAMVPVFIFIWFKLRSKEKDGAGVQTELALLSVLCIVGLVAYTLFSAFIDPYLNWLMVQAYFVAFLFSVAWPIIVSYRVERQKRLVSTQQALKGKKGGGTCASSSIDRLRKVAALEGTNGGGGDGSDGGDIDLECGGARRHHTDASSSDSSITAPFFDLFFVLNHSDASEAFLKFLTKEFSSENAYFWYEVREFALNALELERQLPHWPQRPQTAAAKKDARSPADATTGSGQQPGATRGASEARSTRATLRRLPSRHAESNKPLSVTICPDLDADYASKWASAASTISSAASSARQTTATTNASANNTGAALGRCTDRKRRTTTSVTIAPISGVGPGVGVGMGLGFTSSTDNASSGGNLNADGAGNTGNGNDFNFSLPNSIAHSPRSIRPLPLHYANTHAHRRTHSSMTCTERDSNQLCITTTAITTVVHELPFSSNPVSGSHTPRTNAFPSPRLNGMPSSSSSSSNSIPCPPSLPPLHPSQGFMMLSSPRRRSDGFVNNSSIQHQANCNIGDVCDNGQDTTHNAVAAESMRLQRMNAAAMVAAAQNRRLLDQALDLQQQALDIYDQYLARNAPYEVNLPDAIAQKIRQQSNKVREWVVQSEQKIAWNPNGHGNGDGKENGDACAATSSNHTSSSPPHSDPITVQPVSARDHPKDQDTAVATENDADANTTSPRIHDQPPLPLLPSAPEPTDANPAAAPPSSSSNSHSNSDSSPSSSTRRTAAPSPRSSSDPILIDAPPSAPPFVLSSFFHPSEHAIFELMQRDSFRRFIATKEFKRMLEEVRTAEEERREAMKRMEMDDEQEEDDDDREEIDACRDSQAVISMVDALEKQEEEQQQRRQTRTRASL